ncbi:MAG: Gfo/Idh/MocA family oxidoreductase [Chloroflexi bacterium]|jgi:predicted dehydrogenase|nr:Gfo/Idh/MocA family oxidoreductase [Chloroflexota bacterium]
MSKVRWGLLSTANINKMLIPAIRRAERGELAAVASRSQASADAYAADWGIATAFGSYEAMLASDAVDAVYISLPNRLHAEWSIKAMRAGKHVLCEKPFALNVGDVDRVHEVAQSTGRVVAEAFMYRHHSQTKIAGDFVRSGRLGEVTVIRGVFNFKMGSRENVRLVPELGGGALWDIGCYPVTVAQFLLGGPPMWVFGDQWLGASGVDEVFNGQLHYADGRIAQISCSFRTPFHTFVEVLGTNGRLTMSEPFRMDLGGNRLLFYAGEGEPEEIPVPEEDLYLGEVKDMHAAILDGAAPYLSLEETRNHIRTIVALYESAANHRPVRL